MNTTNCLAVKKTGVNTKLLSSFLTAMPIIDKKVSIVSVIDNDVSYLVKQIETYKKALEQIKDLPLEQSNSFRMIHQLWHFVRWSKSIARNALDKKII
jgi:hypothetical protein